MTTKQIDLDKLAEGMIEALEESKSQLALLAKDPKNNPWVQYCEKALALGPTLLAGIREMEKWHEKFRVGIIERDKLVTYWEGRTTTLAYDNLKLEAQLAAFQQEPSAEVVLAVALAMLNRGREEDGHPTVATFDGFDDETIAFWCGNAQAAVTAYRKAMEGKNG